MQRIMTRTKTAMATIALFVSIFSIAATAAPMDNRENIGHAERMQMRLNVLEQYLDVVESVHSIADDSEKSVIFHLQQLEDMYKKERNPEKVISLYRDILKSTSNQTVRNAAAMKLSQILRRLGKQAEAEELTRTTLNENLSKLK